VAGRKPTPNKNPLAPSDFLSHFQNITNQFGVLNIPHSHMTFYSTSMTTSNKIGRTQAKGRKGNKIISNREFNNFAKVFLTSLKILL
jgi:hypothetical protein